MKLNNDEKLLRKVKKLPPIKACKFVAMHIWSVEQDTTTKELLRIFDEKANSLKTKKGKFCLAWKMYELHAKTGNPLARRKAFTIVEDLYEDTCKTII